MIIPKWLFEPMCKERHKQIMDKDEHGRPIEENVPLPRTDETTRLASPGYKEFPYLTGSSNKRYSTDSSGR